MAITIDDLNPTVLPSREHVFPAMKDGITVKLSVGQILDILVDAAPGQLDTLKELADALGDDPNFAASTAAALALKASLTGVETLTNKTLSGPLSGEFLRGKLHGLVLSNNTVDPANDINVSAGSAASDGTTPFLMALPSAITKRFDAAWAVGSGNGGWLGASAMPNGTGHVFLIRRSDTGVVDVAASASINPTLPSPYDQKRRIGSILRVSGAIKPFIQNDDYFDWVTSAADVSAINPGTSAVLRALSVPTGLKFLVRLAVGFQSTNGAIDNPSVALISSPDTADTAPSLATAFTSAQLIQTSNLSASTGGHLDVFTDVLGQVRSRVSTSSAGLTFYINTRGWVDTRGKLS